MTSHTRCFVLVQTAANMAPPRKKRAKAWLYFTRKDDNIATCNSCQDSISSKGELPPICRNIWPHTQVNHRQPGGVHRRQPGGGGGASPATGGVHRRQPGGGGCIAGNRGCINRGGGGGCIAGNRGAPHVLFADW